MIKQCSRIALAAASLVLATGVPAHAAELPDEPVIWSIKEQSDLSLAWSGERAVLASEGHEWSFLITEALVEVDQAHIVHEGTGQCLVPVDDGTRETVPLELVDCVDSVPWTAVFDDIDAHQDWRFTDHHGRYLALHPEHDAVEGAEIVAEAAPGTGSRHDQEWLFAMATTPPSPPPSTPPSTPPSSPPAPPSPSEEVPQAKLPQTGTGIAAGAVGAVGVVGAGTGILLWLRRRSLRAHW